MTDSAAPTGARLWVGRVLFWLMTLFMIMDTGMHLVRPPFVIEASAKVGMDSAVLLPVGIYQLIAVSLLLTPRFRMLGSLLMTAFLGGAAAAHILVTHTSFVAPIVTCLLLWVGLVCLSPISSATLGLEQA